MPTGLPFDDIRDLLGQMPAVEAESHAHQGLGRLSALASWVAAVQGRAEPAVDRPQVVVFAGTHGIAARDPQNVAGRVAEQVADLRAGHAPLNRVCSTFALGLKVFELGLDHPTRDFLIEPAMIEATCTRTIAYGMEAVAGGVDLLCLGVIGDGGGTPAAALCDALFGADEGEPASPITCMDDPLNALRHYGGRETAAVVGAIIAARLEHVPVILDGLEICAAAAVLHAIDPTALAHCVAAHEGGGDRHARLLQRLGLRPLLDIGQAGSDGLGAASAAGLVKAAVAASAIGGD